MGNCLIGCTLMKNEKFIGLYQRYINESPELTDTLAHLGINKKQYQYFLSTILNKKIKGRS